MEIFRDTRHALDAELRRLRGEIEQKESKTAESFWQRTVAADREKTRLENELDTAQARVSKCHFYCSTVMFSDATYTVTVPPNTPAALRRRGVAGAVLLIMEAVRHRHGSHNCGQRVLSTVRSIAVSVLWKFVWIFA